MKIVIPSHNRHYNVMPIKFIPESYYDKTFIITRKGEQEKLYSSYKDKVNVIGDYGSYQSNVKDIYFLPPTFDKIELELYKKIVSNKEGERLVVVRGKKNQPCTMARFGYPKVQYGGDQELGFDEKFYQFFTSKVN